MGAVPSRDSEIHGERGLDSHSDNNSALQKQVGVCIGLDSWLQLEPL